MKKRVFFFQSISIAIAVGMINIFVATLPLLAAPGEGNMPTYSASPSGSVAASTVSCTNLVVTEGKDAQAPAQVRLTTHTSGVVRSYRYHYGDGTVEIAGAHGIHRYETGGSYQAYVEIQDEKGNWITSAACQTRVELRSSLASSARWGCGELQVLSGQDASVSAQVTLRLATIENKTKISRYKIDFGDGNHQELATDTFTHTYSNPGTYEAKGWVQTAQGTWSSDAQVCKTQVRVHSGLMNTQPKTGVSIEFVIATAVSGIVGISLLTARKALRKLI